MNMEQEILRDFVNERKTEFDKYRKERILALCAECFWVFNMAFKRGEAKAIISAINTCEKFYRRRDTTVWDSHGNLGYEPYFLPFVEKEQYSRIKKYIRVSLNIYFYIIAKSMPEIEFYPHMKIPTNEESPLVFVAESVRQEPEYFAYLFDDKQIYDIDEDGRVILYLQKLGLYGKGSKGIG